MAYHDRALSLATRAHNTAAEGLAQLHVALAYQQLGESGLAQTHVQAALSALAACGNARAEAQAHGLSGVLLAQAGRYDEATAALQQAEDCATRAEATDVLALTYGNQANVCLLQQRHDEAWQLAQRSVAAHEQHGSTTGLATALATLGQIEVQRGHLQAAEAVLHRALALQPSSPSHETIGAIFDTLAQVHLIRGHEAENGAALQQARAAYGAFGRHSSRWYDRSVRRLEARMALRRGDAAGALRAADAMAAEAAPAPDAVNAALLAIEALVALSRGDEADERLERLTPAVEARDMPAAWAALLAVRSLVREAHSRRADAARDAAQAAALFSALGDPYQAAHAHLTAGRVLTRLDCQDDAAQHLARAAETFDRLGATRDREAVARVTTSRPARTQATTATVPVDDDAHRVRRLVDAAVLPAWLDQELTAAAHAVTGAPVALLRAPDDAAPQCLAVIGLSATDAVMRWRARRDRSRPAAPYARRVSAARPADDDRLLVVFAETELAPAVVLRLDTLTAVASQGYAVGGTRTHASVSSATAPRPIIPGFLIASAAMQRLTDQIRQLQTHALTVLITGESGTGKELVARAVHAHSPRASRVFLPFNCATVARDLVDSQLFGHRRGAFTGATTEHVGLVRAADGGTLFLDEVGDLPLDVQPRLLRVLESSEVLPVGDVHPRTVDVRIIAATNVDLDERLADGRFREDLYYRLGVIRLHVPPLRERPDEIPLLATYFLRAAAEASGGPACALAPDAMDALLACRWPGNVRQLRNELWRAGALCRDAGIVTAADLSREVTSPGRPSRGLARTHVPARDTAGRDQGPTAIPTTRLADAVDDLERMLLQRALQDSDGNRTLAARALGITRRGLYLKLRRLGLDL